MLQGDSNLVLYTSDNRPVWASNTVGKGAAYLIMRNDGNLGPGQPRPAPSLANRHR